LSGFDENLHSRGRISKHYFGKIGKSLVSVEGVAGIFYMKGREETEERRAGLRNFWVSFVVS
jgi:hypothetical protein